MDFPKVHFFAYLLKNKLLTYATVFVIPDSAADWVLVYEEKSCLRDHIAIVMSIVGILTRGELTKKK